MATEPKTGSSALERVVEVLASTGWGAEVLDERWNLVWISDALRAVMGDPDDEALGIGHFVVHARALEPWSESANRERYLEVCRELGPYIAYDLGDEYEGLIADTADDVREIMAGVEPSEAPEMVTAELGWDQEGMPSTSVRVIGARLRDSEGKPIGTAWVYGPDLAAPVLALVARGDRAMFERAAEMLEPARRPAAILFADLEASGRLSRHLPTTAYFELVREITTAVDDVVIERRGLVGKHAGDGVTALFIAEQAGSESAAARAAIEAGRRVCDAAREAAERLRERGVPIDPGDVALNVGIHWGSGLYVGQIVTGGRLEVTALGDEMNEAARIEQSASDGAVLASKTAVEHLEPDDADALGLDPAALRYRAVGELEGASEKAVRDAGTIAVADVSA